MEIMRINKGIKFYIKVIGLSLGRNYVANLCTEDVTKVYTAKTNRKDTCGPTFNP